MWHVESSWARDWTRASFDLHHSLGKARSLTCCTAKELPEIHFQILPTELFHWMLLAYQLGRCERNNACLSPITKVRPWLSSCFSKARKKAPKKPPVIHSYAHSRGSAESTMELVFGQGQVKGFGNSSQRRGNAKFCTEPPWVNLCLKSCRPPAQRQLALTHPLSLPSYGPESCRLQGSSLIQSDLANQKKKKRISTKMCKCYNWVLNILHQLQLSQDSLPSHSLVRNTSFSKEKTYIMKSMSCY